MSDMYLTILENMPFGKAFSNLVTFFRPSEWVDKIQLNMGAAFLILIDLSYNNFQITPGIFNIISIFLVYQFFLACFGYAINAYADREFDSMVGKYKGTSYFSNPQLLTILIFLSIGSLGIPLLFDNLIVKILGIVAFIFSAGYSLKPIRLKNKGFFGIVGVTLPQRTFMILFFGLLVNANLEFVGILMGWSLFVGIIMEIGHQMLDYKNDELSRAHTWIVQTEISKVKSYSFVSMFFFLLFSLMPIFYLAPEIGFAVFLIMLVLSGHSIFYFVEGWKKYNRFIFAKN